jgi:ribosomal protein S18 acetylase RimI-like enzyme
VVIEVVAGDSATRLKSLRLSALKDTPEAFGAKHADELLISDSQWQDRLKHTYWCFVVADGVDIGLLAVDRADKDRNSDCWLSSWWVSAAFRGQGVAALMMDWVIKLSQENEWKIIGLGVWPENLRARSAYKKLGFVEADKPLPSRSKPGQMYLGMYRQVK